MNLAWWVLWGIGFFATPPSFWPGLLGGALLFLLILRSQYREGLVWFSSLPGLYHFWGITVTKESVNQAFYGWGITAAVLVLLALAASSLRNHGRWAILWGLPLVFLRPEGWTLGLLAVAHGLAVLEREQGKSSDLGRRFVLEPAALWTLGTILVALALAIGPLSPPKTHRSEETTPAQTAEATPTTAPLQVQPDTPSTPKKIVVRRAADTPFARFALASTDLLFNASLLFLLLITGLMVVAMLRERTRTSRIRRSWLLMFGLVIFGWGMVLVWYLLNQKASSGGGSLVAGSDAGTASELGNAPDIQIITTNQDGLFAVGLLMALLAAAVLGVGLYVLLRNLRDVEQSEESQTPKLLYRAGGWHSGPPEHRIRRAYYDFLHRMEHQGFARMSFESAREYAARLTQIKPLVGGYLLELVALYEPVRYGGNPSLAQAERAEFLAAQIPPHYEESTQ